MAKAPKKPKLKKDGTKSRQGEGGGKPPIYKSEKELAEKLLEYFDSCEDKKTMPNKAGLCVFLNISRPTYNEYKKKYPNAIKGTEDYIEDSWIQRLAGNAPTGAIFYLKNAFREDYKDKHETDITTKGEKIKGFNYMPPNETDNSSNG